MNRNCIKIIYFIEYEEILCLKMFFYFADVLKELKEKGCIEKMSPELHKSLMATELQCNQCTYKPKNMPQLKEHLLTHIKK